MVVKYKEFISPDAAIGFAKTISKENLINISHSIPINTYSNTSIIVWYWE